MESKRIIDHYFVGSMGHLQTGYAGIVFDFEYMLDHSSTYKHKNIKKRLLDPKCKFYLIFIEFARIVRTNFFCALFRPDQKNFDSAIDGDI